MISWRAKLKIERKTRSLRKKMRVVRKRNIKNE
jgi:hypothetical protein